jgi:hypothetical protein
VKETVQRLVESLCRPGRIAVYFVEVFGRSIGGGAKNYTKTGKVGFRLFDVVLIENFGELFAWPAERIAHWRENGGQRYVDADEIVKLAAEVGFQTVPALFDTAAAQIPTDLEETYRFLLKFESSQCKLDDDANGVPEGVVVRSPDRSRIAKLRREDYERTLRRRKK